MDLGETVREVEISPATEPVPLPEREPAPDREPAPTPAREEPVPV